MEDQHKNDFDLAFERGGTRKKEDRESRKLEDPDNLMGLRNTKSRNDLNSNDETGNGKRPGKKRRRRGASLEILLGLVLVWAVIATLFCAYVLLFDKDADEAEVETDTVTYTAEEMAHVEESVKAEAREDFLDDLKAKMQSGNGSVQMLRDYFPDEIVYLDSGVYRFYPILDSVPKHPYDDIKIVEDEESKIFEAYNGTEKVSSFGIDISKHNGEIDWDTLATTGVDFAIMRLGIRGYGTGEIVLDEQYINNIEGANRVGIDAGVYFFPQAITLEESIEEAEFVLENIKEYDVKLPIVIDVEAIHADGVRSDVLSVEERTDLTIAFCDRIEEAGYETMIYGNIVSFTKLLNISKLNDYPKWYAFYDDYIYYPYDFDIWQYSDSGILPGIEGKVDFNIIFDREKIEN